MRPGNIRSNKQASKQARRFRNLRDAVFFETSYSYALKLHSMDTIGHVMHLVVPARHKTVSLRPANAEKSFVTRLTSGQFEP